jgi:hypothetical protein
VTPYGLVEVTDVSEELSAFIFRTEEYAKKAKRASCKQSTDGANAFLRNVGENLSDYTVSYSRLLLKQ